jgi:hypothetical protein
MIPERQPATERREQKQQKKEPATLHYEYSKGYLPTVNPKSNESGDSQPTPHH